MNFIIKKRNDRGSWAVQWFARGAKNRKSFSTQDAAIRWVRDQRQLAAMGASPAEVSAAARIAAGTGFDLESLVRAGLEQMRGIGAHRADATMTFAQATQELINRAGKKGARPRTLKNYKARASLLNKTFGSRVAVAISATEIDEYLAKVPNKQGVVGGASVSSKQTHLAFVKMALRLVGVVNPLEKCELPKVNSDVRYFRLGAVKTILAATPVKARGFVAVALFGCVRPENLEMVPEECISANARTIRISQEISKDRNTHVLSEVVPEVLWEWLKIYPYQQIKWQPLQRRLKRALGSWIQDGLRHTGATFYCAAKGVNATARLLTHESESLVRSNYAGVVLDEAVAKEFLGLAPDKITFIPTDEVQWPASHELAELLNAEPGMAIAKRLGCSGAAVTKHCKTRGIVRDGSGNWTVAA